ncbi:hypothetical protein T492DRAFT_836110 [Pavlovales sp. CCMP2436]|nr:hypothetical protein T492DRAFT_836110 [Pavlovales sp. CCMP2436]
MSLSALVAKIESETQSEFSALRDAFIEAMRGEMVKLSPKLKAWAPRVSKLKGERAERKRALTGGGGGGGDAECGEGEGAADAEAPAGAQLKGQADKKAGPDIARVVRLVIPTSARHLECLSYELRKRMLEMFAAPNLLPVPPGWDVSELGARPWQPREQDFTATADGAEAMRYAHA